MRRLTTYVISFLVIFIATLFIAQYASGQNLKTFKTKYADVYYENDKDFDDFIWHIAGRRTELPDDMELVTNRIDRIVDRVQSILGMMPADLRFAIYLHREPMQENRRAFYDNKTKSIHISIEQATDGVVAHEIAHAIINKYFDSPPQKIQEILTQYVDKYLWSDY